VETCTFETGEVYAIDIAMSTGDGKTRDMGECLIPLVDDLAVIL
jgi:hypothetical protein